MIKHLIYNLVQLLRPSRKQCTVLALTVETLNLLSDYVSVGVDITVISDYSREHRHVYPAGTEELAEQMPPL